MAIRRQNDENGQPFVRQTIDSSDKSVDPSPVFVVHLLDGSRLGQCVGLIDDENRGSARLLTRSDSANARLHLLEGLGDELSHFANGTATARHQAETENRHLDLFT